MIETGHKKFSGIFRSELALWIGIVTTLIFLSIGKGWLMDLSNPLKFSFLFLWLFTAMLWLSFGVVRHADCLAILLGEPYGTLILTLAVIGIEVIMISAVMLTGIDNPTLARDTMFSVLMIVLNGMLGVTLIIGGFRHHEQEYNLAGASAYLGVLFPLAVLGLVVPRFTISAPGGQVSALMAVYLLVMSAGLYAVFLMIQTMRHSQFFKQPLHSNDDGLEEDDHGDLAPRSIGYHAAFLIFTMLPIVLLSKNMAKLVDHGIVYLQAPQALGGFLVAILVLTPEAVAAARAALANKLQRTVNITLGSSLSTIGLTIPAVLAISLFTGRSIELGLEPVQIVLLTLTLLVSTVNFVTGRTNVLQGAVHIILFISYVILIFD